MTLDIVIVNYNVCHFLQQCLESVYSAHLPEGWRTEVYVVDNNSIDGSLEMLRTHFPQVHLIANSDNVGFARANNQAIRQSHGELVLLLNPDTLVETNTLARCIDFMDIHLDCGGLGIKMINGEGTYLKESKRGFPTPETSFYKISGLIRLLPHHKRIAAYYRGELSNDATAEVEILSGAFLMTRRCVLDQIGLLDEDYFMYGEDIDFSWRIHLAGYKNFYYPEARIIHYKGECTKKGSMNYVHAFYNAMSIFVRRYFAGTGARIFNILMQMAIGLRAAIAYLNRAFHHLMLPMADFILSAGGFIIIKQLWCHFRTSGVDTYPIFYTWGILPLYVLILLVASFFMGAYDRPYHTGRMMKGIIAGTTILLVFYSLLDESMRYSRAIVLLGALWSLASTITLREVCSLLRISGFRPRQSRSFHYLVIGDEEQQHRLTALFDRLGIQPRSITVFPTAEDFLQQVSHTQNHNTEVVFCTAYVPIETVVDTTLALRNYNLRFRILPPTGDILIGSGDILDPEELYAEAPYEISTPRCRRSKRLFDFSTSLAILTASPLLFWFQHRKKRFFPNCWAVLTGRATWVGYTNPENPSVAPYGSSAPILPALPPAVFQTRHRIPFVKHPDATRLNIDYARHYTAATDFIILFKNINRI